MSNRYRKYVSLLLIILFVFFNGITETFAWQNIGQKALNESRGNSLFNIELLKLEKLIDGTLTENPIPNTVFYLFTLDGKQIGSRYITDSYGKINVDLPKGEYYFEEVYPEVGYGFDVENGEAKKKYPFTVVGNEREIIKIIAYNKPLTGNLTINKILQNNYDIPLTEEEKLTQFEFTVSFSDGGSYNYSINDGELHKLESGGKIYLRHGEKAVFENIPVGVLYNVLETPKSEYIISSNGHQGNITHEGSVANFFNINDNIYYGSLIVSKEVVGEDADFNKEFEFTAVIDGKIESFTLKHGDKKEFLNIPIGTEYSITEKDYSNEGYIAKTTTYNGKIDSKEEVLLPFINIYQKEKTTGEIIVKKEVIGENADKEKIFTFEAEFEGDGAPESPKIFNLKAEEEIIFKDIPSGVKYTIKEIDPAGYIPLNEVQSGVTEGGKTEFVKFENKVSEEKIKKSKIIVTKKVDKKYPEEDLNKEFNFTLIVNNNETKFTLKANQSKEFDVPIGSNYEVREEDYFDDGYSQYIVNGYGTVTKDEIEAIITNTYVKYGEVDIKGEKKWELCGYPDNLIPESIVIRLKNGDLLVEEKTITRDENNQWNYKFTVPKYDLEGTEIKYTIEEVNLDNFLPKYDGYNIINTYIHPIEFDPPIINKIVKGENYPETQFRFLIEGEEGIPMPEGSIGNIKILTLKGSGRVELGKIKFEKTGTYVYTISELNDSEKYWNYDVSKYNLIVTVTEEDGKLVANEKLEKEGDAFKDIIFINDYKMDNPDPNKPSGDNPDPNKPSGDDSDPNKPSGDNPDPDKPSGDDSDPNKPSGDNLDPDKPSGDNPDPNKPSEDNPDPNKPSGDDSDPDKPSGDNPDPNKPSVNNQDPDKPSVDNPDPNKPSVDNPDPNKPSVNNQDPDKPSGDNPDPNKPSGDSSDINKPGIDNSDPNKPSGDSSDINRPSIDNSDPNRPSGDSLGINKPSVDNSDEINKQNGDNLILDNNSSKNSIVDNNRVVETGDNNKLLFWIFIMISSIISFIVVKLIFRNSNK